MTTTLQIAERLARRLKKGTLPALDMAETMDVLEAINAGLQECYELLPSWQRRTTVTMKLAAPVNVNLSLVNDSVNLADGGSVFLESQIGRSVVAAGDPNWNEVQSITQLLEEYRGSTGVVAATIYGDSVFNEVTTFDGLTGDPMLSESRERLTLFNARAAGMGAEVGQPRHYWIEPAAAALGGAPYAFLRVFPAPDRAYALRCDMEFRPSRIGFASLHQAAEIPLAEQLIDRALLPLCEVRLLRSPAWGDASLRNLILEDAQAARAALRGQRQSVNTPNNRVGTPPGY